jgi:hypothetical protein
MADFRHCAITNGYQIPAENCGFRGLVFTDFHVHPAFSHLRIAEPDSFLRSRFLA